jgi:hydroxymethylglutaryl-CoA reductase
MMILQNFNDRSRIPGFYKLSMRERQELIAKLANLSIIERKHLENFGNLGMNLGDTCSENVIGGFTLPFSVATNFLINSKPIIVPMVTEEASVVAAASYGAKLARKHGGFICSPVKNIMIGQILIIPSNGEDIEEKILPKKLELLEEINRYHPTLTSFGGGAVDIKFRKILTSRGNMVVLHLEVDVKDAMGANIVNTMTENLAKLMREFIKSDIRVNILSNLAISRMSSCTAVFDTQDLGGEEIVQRILDLYAFAEVDPFRTVTHNKGIMNGVCAVALATGNDTRAIEAGAHAYASMNGKYGPLSKFNLDSKGNLKGELSIPLQMGTVGGITSIHPMCKIARKIMNITSAGELIQIASAVGLSQNVAALRALVDEGIQDSHMRLHKRKEQ